MKRYKKISATLNLVSRPVRGIWPRLPEAIIGIGSFVIVVFCCLTYSPSLAKRASELFSSNNKYLALIDGFFNPFRNRHLLLNSGFPIYDLKINRQQYAILEKVVEQAKKKRWMSDDIKDWAKAKFIYEGREYDAQVRVRGAHPNHWEGPKKSWRIKFTSQNFQHNGKILAEPIYFGGKRQINLIIPSDRGYILSYFINSLLRGTDLVVPNDRFAVLRINGAIQGLYYEVEHFDNPLLAAHDRPETTIFGQSDRAMHFEKFTKYGTPIASDAEYDLGSLRRQVDAVSDLGLRAMQVLIDHSLYPTLTNFERVQDVLDMEKYLSVRAITTLCNTNHVRFGSDNFKLYYNSSRGLLEPIPWDITLLRMPNEPGTIDFWNSRGPDEIQRAVLMDPQLRSRRNKILWDWVSDGGDSLISRFNTIYHSVRPLAWADVLSVPIQGYRMDLVKKDFKHNVRRVHKVLSTSAANVTYRLEADDRAALEVAAMNFSGIHLRALQFADSLVFEGHYRLFEDENENSELDLLDPLVAETVAVDGKIQMDVEKFIFPELNYDSAVMEGRQWEFFETLTERYRFFLVGKLAAEKRHPLEWSPPQIEVTAVNAVTGRLIPSAWATDGQAQPENSIGITAIDASDPWDLEAPRQSLAEFIEGHPQFSGSREYPGTAILSGKVTISGAIIVPQSVLLIIRPGADITMKPRASVLCYGGLLAVGAPEKRIRIHSDESGEAWDSFAVVRPPQKVVLKYVDVQGGGQAQLNGILFTGGIAIHDGDLEMEYCRFIDMQSEDAVNLKNGRIVMRNCLFSNTASDAIDLDFCTGEVQNNQFMNTVGDGLDLSGARNLVISENWFENIGDKGVSVGENSHPLILNNFFGNCVIGFSTKDLSHARVAHCTFVNNQLVIEAKRKKAMFGGASAEVVNSVFSGNKILLEEDYFSNGRVVVQNSLVDAPVDWPTCKTTSILFVDPQNENYLLDPMSIMNNGFHLADPEWLNVNMNGDPGSTPGIFTRLTPIASSAAELN